MPDVSQFYHFLKRLAGNLAPGTLLLALLYLRIRSHPIHLAVSGTPKSTVHSIPSATATTGQAAPSDSLASVVSLAAHTPGWGWLDAPVWDWVALMATAVLAYFLGNALTNVSLGVLKFVNWVIGLVWKRLRRRRISDAWIERHEFFFDLETEERINQHIGTRTMVPDPYFARVLPKGRSRWLAARMYVVRHSQRLGTELLELEGDINVHAGLILPVALLARFGPSHAMPGLWWGVWILLIYLGWRAIALMQREALALYSACLVVRGKVLPTLAEADGSEILMDLGPAQD